ncbi:hypothetical protein ACWEK5_21790 [Rhodococcus koreensis]
MMRRSGFRRRCAHRSPAGPSVAVGIALDETAVVAAGMIAEASRSGLTHLIAKAVHRSISTIAFGRSVV